MDHNRMDRIIRIGGASGFWGDSMVAAPQLVATGALDYPTGKLVLEVIERVNRETGTTTLVITHNAAIAGMADRVLRLADGRIVSDQRNARRLSPAELSW
jgi:ABC-type methionine transport system ATPase subunit